MNGTWLHFSNPPVAFLGTGRPLPQPPLQDPLHSRSSLLAMKPFYPCVSWACSLLLWVLLLWSSPQFRKRSHVGILCHAAEAPLVLTPFDPTLEVSHHELTTEARDRLTIFPRRQVPQMRHIQQPGALLLAVNIREIALLPGDRVVIRDARNVTAATIMAGNQSVARKALRRPKPLLWNHPFVVTGSRVTIEYLPSLLTLALPIDLKQLDNPVLVVESYTFASFPRRGRLTRDDTSDDNSDDDDANLESTVGARNEMKPAICYKKAKPEWYAKARSVARLIIAQNSTAALGANGAPRQGISYDKTKAAQDKANDQPMMTFCTGWLVGRGNHMLTNYHCFYQLTRPIQGGLHSAKAATGRLRSIDRAVDDPTSPCSSAEGSRGDGSGRDAPRVTYSTQARVNFLAEAKSCNASSSRTGQPQGEIDATEVEIVASSEDLDYCLLRLRPSRASSSPSASGSTSEAEEKGEKAEEEIDLARTFGYLTLRESGPVDGEAIYIPQHPNGELKTIASVKDGKPATIHLAGNESRTSTSQRGGFDDVSVWYNADTAPGSSGSPVLSQEDDTVVALHHAGTGPVTPVGGYGWISRWVNRYRGKDSENQYNIGIRIDAIVADLREKDALPPCAVAEKCQVNGKGKRKGRTVCCETKW